MDRFNVLTKYKTFNIPIKRILKKTVNKKIFKKLSRTVIDINKLTIYTYQFVRLWILEKYHNNHQNIPKIDIDIFRIAFKVLLKDSCGPKVKGENSLLLDEFEKFY